MESYVVIFKSQHERFFTKLVSAYSEPLNSERSLTFEPNSSKLCSTNELYVQSVPSETVTFRAALQLAAASKKIFGLKISNSSQVDCCILIKIENSSLYEVRKFNNYVFQ